MTPPTGWRKSQQGIGDSAEGSQAGVAETAAAPTPTPEPEKKPVAAAPVKKPVPAMCEFCGARPKQATRDGIHDCQCRRRLVSK
jgi:hypothetical protein